MTQTSSRLGRAFFTTLVLALLVFLVAFFSFGFNGLGVVSAERFSERKGLGEHRILDGILRAQVEETIFIPGTYRRDGFEGESQQAEVAYMLFEDSIVSDEFVIYSSQYGLFGKWLNGLVSLVGLNVGFLKLFAAFLMSLLVASFFFVLSREFGYLGGLAFTIPLIFSPYIVTAANDIYWIPVSWFLPMFLAFALGAKALVSHKWLLILLGLVYLAFLVRFLSGYEYMTTIGIAAAVPFLYYWVKHRASWGRLIGVMVSLFLTFLFAFGTSLVIHVSQLEREGIAGVQELANKSTRRLFSAELHSTAVCRSSPDQCEETVMLENSNFDENLGVLLARYLLIPRTIPFIDPTMESLDIQQRDRERIAVLWRNPSVGELLELRKMDSGLLAVFVVRAIFPVFLLVFFLLVWRAEHGLRVAVMFSLLAPISWYVLAKEHSVGHFYMNVGLWYVPFIPMAFLMIATLISPRDKRG